MRHLAVVAAMLATGGCGEPAAPARPVETPAIVAAGTTGTPVAGPAPPAAFVVCSACHAAAPGVHGIGPSLAGAFRGKAAAIPGYNYSDALRQSGLVWDEATLHRFLAEPRSTVPGTTMAYAGLRDAERRQQIIDWLKTI